jgi:hypothetical protein
MPVHQVPNELISGSSNIATDDEVVMAKPNANRATRITALCLFLVAATLVHAQQAKATARTSQLSTVQAKQISALAHHLVLPDYILDYVFNATHFAPPPNLVTTWRYYPDYRKVLIAASMAQSHDPNGGADRFLAMLAYALADRGDPIASEANLSGLRTNPAYAAPTPLTFGALPDALAPSHGLSQAHVQAIQSLSKYLQSGALGTPQSIIVRYTGKSFDDAFHLLETSDSPGVALAKALSGFTEERRTAVLKRIVADAIQVYPAVKHEDSLALLLPPEFRGHTDDGEGPGLGFRPERGGPPGKGPMGGGVSSAEVLSSFKELITESYTSPAAKKFDSMRTTAKGFGGIIFGADVHRSVEHPVRSLTFVGNSGTYGTILITFNDGTKAKMLSVTPEEASASYQLVYANSLSVDPWTPGEGIGLVGLTYDCRPGLRKQEYDKSTANQHERVVLNPILRNTSLGWSAIVTDGQSRFPEFMAKGMASTAASINSRIIKESDHDLINHTFTPIRHLGWKITDVPMDLQVSNGVAHMIRSDKEKVFAVGLRRTAYLEMTPLRRVKATSTAAESTELVEAFRYYFYNVSPMLMSSSPAFKAINHFAAVLALTRLAKQDGATFNEPRIAVHRPINTPEYVWFSDAGVTADSNPICIP